MTPKIVEQFRWRCRGGDWERWNRRWGTDGEDNVRYPEDRNFEYEFRRVLNPGEGQVVLPSNPKLGDVIVNATEEGVEVVGTLNETGTSWIGDIIKRSNAMAEETPKFITKDSGKRHEFSSGMVRDTQDGKPRFGLVMPKDVPYKEQLLTRFAELMGRGAEKYSARNWELGSGEEELERAKESALRHLLQWYHGETDEDHAAAVLFNLTSAEYYSWRLRNAQPEG